MQLKFDQGFTVLAIEQVEGSTLLDKLELDADKKYAIVMGNEVKGRRKPSDRRTAA